MDSTVAAGVLEAIAASALRLAGVLRGAPAGPPAESSITFNLGGDLAPGQVEACLTVLSGTVGMEAMFAAVKVHAVNGYDEAAQAIAGLAASPAAEQTARDMGIQGRGRLRPDGQRTHGREGHFLDPDAPNPARVPAGEMVPSRFRAKARTWRERHHPDSIEKRHARSAADRRLEYSPDRDGMAWLSAYLPADQAAGIWNRTTTAARALQGPTESRTLTQLRADNAAAWLLSGEAGLIPSPKAQVLVTVPVFALLGLTGEPATLDGYGPIPPSMATALIADGAESFHRVLTDPRDGAPLEIGRDSYRSPPPCANGCASGTPSARSPAAATSPWTTTAATKDKPPSWISPTGRRYSSEQPDQEPPIWPQQLEDPEFYAGNGTGHGWWAVQERTDQEWVDQKRSDQENGAGPDGIALPEDQLYEGPWPDWALHIAKMNSVT